MSDYPPKSSCRHSNTPPDNYMVKALWPQVKHPVTHDMELYMLFGDKICRKKTSFWTRFQFWNYKNHRYIEAFVFWPLCGHNSCGHLICKQDQHRTNDVQTHRDLSWWCKVCFFQLNVLFCLDNIPQSARVPDLLSNHLGLACHRVCSRKRRVLISQKSSFFVGFWILPCW